MNKTSYSSFVDAKSKKRYFIILSSLLILSLLLTLGLLVYKNPVPMDSPAFIPIVKRRVNLIVAIFIAAICHSMATIAFQTITNNKLITPSILGFEALYSAIQTSTVYIFGLTGLVAFSGNIAFISQIVIMLVFCMLLYGLLLFGRKQNIQTLLLVGVILGSGLRSFSSFMTRLLSPNEFDILQARLFASVNNASSESFPIAIPLVIITGFLLYLNSNKLNVLSLGKDIAVNLGLSYQRNCLYVLALVSLLMAISTALIGPLTFLGFLIALLTGQIINSYDHKYIFPLAILLAYLVLTTAYFIMNYVFYAQGVVSIIIELVGGMAFLITLLKRGHL